MPNYLSLAIRKLCPSAEFSFNNDDYSTIKWDVLEGNAPSQAEIDAAIEELKQEEAQNELDKITARQAVLDKLGLTAEELKALGL